MEKELFGYAPQTTNNRMELMAAIQGLLAIKEPCEVDITTDAEYVRQGITQWIVRWKRRYWRKVANVDLWMELDAAASGHKTSWLWTKGHAGDADNNRCDWLARNAAQTQTSSWADGRQHGALRLNLGPDYVPEVPKLQAGLFDDWTDDAEEGALEVAEPAAIGRAGSSAGKPASREDGEALPESA